MASSLIMKQFVGFARSSIVAFRQPAIKTIIPICVAITTNPRYFSIMSRFSDLLRRPQDGLSRSTGTIDGLEYMMRSNIDVPGIKKYEKTDEGLRIFLDLGFGNWDTLREIELHTAIGMQSLDMRATVRRYIFYKHCSTRIKHWSGYKYVTTDVRKDGGIVLNFLKVNRALMVLEEQKLAT